MNKYELVFETKNKEHLIGVFRYADDIKDYCIDWVRRQDVKLLTLDGSFGGRNGTQYDHFSCDTEAQDDYHIGKKYNSQTFIRKPIVISMRSGDAVEIRYADNNDVHNAYLIVSKRELRENDKQLKRAKTEELERTAQTMCDEFIETFNKIYSGGIYSIKFKRPCGNDYEVFNVENVYECSDKNGFTCTTISDIKANMPFIDKEFNEMLTDLEEVR